MNRRECSHCHPQITTCNILDSFFNLLQALLYQIGQNVGRVAKRFQIFILYGYLIVIREKLRKILTGSTNSEEFFIRGRSY